jgi:hypothetical protein
MIASSGYDGTIKLWSRDGNKLLSLSIKRPDHDSDRGKFF